MVTSHRRGLGLGVSLGLIGAAGFGTSGPLSKSVLDAGLTPLQLSQARQCVTAAVLLLLVAVIRPAALRVRPRQLPYLFAYGVVSYALLQTLYLVAIDRIPVGIALLIQFTAPVMVALWVRTVRGVRLPGVTWAGAVLVVVGLVFVGEVWRGLRLDAVGVAAAAGTALCLFGFYLMAERQLTDLEPLSLVVWGAVAASVLFAVVQPVWEFPFRALAGRSGLLGAHWPLWLLLIAIGVVSTAVPAVAEVAALRHIASPTASVLGTAEVVLGAAFAWLLIGERLNTTQLFGGAVMFAGIALAQTRPLPQSHPAGEAAADRPVPEGALP